MLQHPYQTQRLSLTKLNVGHATFMLELMNTAEWIRFIGDRNVPTLDATRQYIHHIENNPMAKYWVVCQTQNQEPMGIITFLKRLYLDHWDIGFAFLPRFTGKGYALESAGAILAAMASSGEHDTILASALGENASSIKLLKNLGFEFSREIQVHNEVLQLYAKTSASDSLKNRQEK